MSYIHQFGTSYYFISDDGQCLNMTYPQYLSLMEFDKGTITEDEIPERVKYHIEQQALVKCPFCNLYLSLETVQYLETMNQDDREQFHKAIAHQRSAPIPFQGEAYQAKVYSEFEEYF